MTHGYAPGRTAMKRILGFTFALSVLMLAYGPFAWAHWPDQAPHQIANLGEFKLEGGGVIKNLKMSYVTHGKLNAAKDNAILFMHGFGAEPSSGGSPDRTRPSRSTPTSTSSSARTQLGNTQTTFEHSTSPTQQRSEDELPGLQPEGPGEGRVQAGHGSVGNPASARRDRDLVGGYAQRAVRGELSRTSWTASFRSWAARS